MRSEFVIRETPEHGLILTVTDLELADQFDDYLAEKCYVFYAQKFNTDSLEFYFGQITSPERLAALLDRFSVFHDSPL